MRKKGCYAGKQAEVDCRHCALTYERQRVPRAGQQVIGVEQEEGVAQDEGHLEVGAHGAFGRKQEAEEVDHHEEAAGDQQVDHVDCRMPSKRDLKSEAEFHFPHRIVTALRSS